MAICSIPVKILIVIALYFFGIENILIVLRYICGIASYIIGWIPLIEYPLNLLIWILSVIPYYSIYLLLVLAINVIFELVVHKEVIRCHLRQKKPHGILISMCISVIFPSAISYILINKDVVNYLILPFHMAFFTLYLQEVDRQQSLYRPIRNFIIFILLMPIIFAPLNVLNWVFFQKVLPLEQGL